MTDDKLDIKISSVEEKVMDVIHRITRWISGLSSIVFFLLVGILLYKLRCARKNLQAGSCSPIFNPTQLLQAESTLQSEKPTECGWSDTIKKNELSSTHET
jgi:hypothetical protein